MFRKIAALSLTLMLALGFSACGAQTADYMVEAQRISQWGCYETQTELNLSVKDAENIPLDSAEIHIQAKASVDRQKLAASLSAAVEADIQNLRLYGADTDVHTTYDMQPLYMCDGLVYLPVHLVRDRLTLDSYEGYEDNLSALDEQYIALDPGLTEENLDALQQLQQGAYTPEQYEQLGLWLSKYTTGLRFGKSGRTYTLSGRLSQLPEEIFACARFLYENTGELNDILELGITEEDIAAMEAAGQSLTLTEEDLRQLQTAWEEAGLSGDFTIKIAFTDSKMTQDMTARFTVEGYGEWTFKAQSVTSRLSSLTVDIPASAGPMTATELENLIYGWSEETTQVSAWVDMEDGWTSTAYWDGAPAYDYTYIDVREESGQVLLGFRGLMEAMGFTVEYDAESDTIYLVNRAEERTAVELYEENGQSFITLQQLKGLGFDVIEYESSLDILYLPSVQ